MFSVVYLIEHPSNLSSIEQTVKQHCKVYDVPFFTLPVDELPSIGMFIHSNVKTPRVFLARDNTYINIKNVCELIKSEPSHECFAYHYVNDVLDIDCGYLIKTTHFHTLSPRPFVSFEECSKDVTKHLTTIPNLNINLRLGFNKLNFEGSYSKIHMCDKCQESFTKGIVYTLGNMTNDNMMKYHAVVDKIRLGKNVQIALALMIKDEEEKIEETLNYYKNHTFFPEIYILDTGSTDKTLERVNAWGKSHPLTKIVIYEEPFVDFSTTRNYILDLVYTHSTCEYIISVDCNDEMKGQEKCITLLGEYYRYPVVFIDQVWKGEAGDPITFTNIRLVKNNKIYRWRYRVHEVLMPTDESLNIQLLLRLTPDIHLYQFRETVYETVKGARYHRDLKFFLEDHAKYPDDKRIAYYLAQTCFFTQDYENCIKYSKVRLEMNKPEERDEEVYQSILRICKCMAFLGKPQYKIKKWLWFAWDYFMTQHKKDIEPLLHIAQMYEDTDIDTAMHLYQLACSTPKPIFNLPIRNELYGFERYKKMAEMYYKKRDFDKVYQYYNMIVTNDIKTPDQQAVGRMLHLYYPSYHRPDKPLVVIYGGFFYNRPWNGKMFYEKTISLGGSESMVIKLAHLLKNDYYVYVFTHTDEEIEYDGVNYLKVERYNDFISVNKIKHLILSRDSSKTGESKIENTHLWLHDLVHVGEMKDPAIYTNIITLTPFHKKFYEEYITQLPSLSASAKSSIRSKLKVIPNIGWSGESFSYKEIKECKTKKNKMRFIYSSCPTRGLEKVVKDFTLIKEEYPESELYIYSDFSNDYVKSQMMNINEFIHTIQTTHGIFNIGRLPEKTFLSECKKAAFWYYPTDFKETFCITAVQMMMNGVIPIYSQVGALPYIIDNAGIKVSNPEDLMKALKTLESDDTRNTFIKRGLERVKQYHETPVKREWDSLLRDKNEKNEKKK
jgi:glycosyltransferase involved in cell wall biosynthesis